jgi:hypothetical protein
MTQIGESQYGMVYMWEAQHRQRQGSTKALVAVESTARDMLNAGFGAVDVDRVVAVIAKQEVVIVFLLAAHGACFALHT